MVGLQNWYFKEYLSGIKSEMEYKMLFSRPEGKPVSRLGVLISRQGLFCRIFHRIIAFPAALIFISAKGCRKYSIG